MFLTQLDTTLNAEIQDWACSTMGMLAMHQYSNGSLLSAQQINTFYEAAKQKIVKINGKKLPLITTNNALTAYVNDFDQLCNFVKEYFNFGSNLKYIGTIENGSLWIAPPYRDGQFWFEYCIARVRTSALMAHFVLYKNGEIIYNPNPNLKPIAIEAQYLFREV